MKRKKERFRHLLMMRVELGIREIILCPGSAAAATRGRQRREPTPTTSLTWVDKWTCCRKGEGSGGPSRAHPPCVSTSGSPGVGTGRGYYTARAVGQRCGFLTRTAPHVNERTPQRWSRRTLQETTLKNSWPDTPQNKQNCHNLPNFTERCFYPPSLSLSLALSPNSDASVQKPTTTVLWKQLVA